MTRLALAAIVFCSTLLAALVQTAPGLSAARESSRAATTTASVSLGCTPDEDGEWSPTHDPTASITESAWKWRTLHAGLSATARPRTIVAILLADSSPARAPDAPSYLLHTPLLI